MLKWIVGCFLLFCSALWSKPIEIVAAENFYGEIAKLLGGSYVSVTSVMSNPNQDPHLFSSSPSTATAVANADLIIYSGIDYDPWMPNLIGANTNQNTQILIVADLIGKKMGDNPHIWYDPNTMPAYAKALFEQLIKLDPEHSKYFQAQLTKFNSDYKSLTDLIAKIKKAYQGTPVIGTEPVFNYMADALGLTMYGLKFQLSIMNDTEPSVSDRIDFEDRIRKKMVKVLIYNNQVTNPVTDRMQDLAKKAGVPVVGVSETEPSNKSYLTWMIDQLNALKKALGG